VGSRLDPSDVWPSSNDLAGIGHTVRKWSKVAKGAYTRFGLWVFQITWTFELSGSPHDITLRHRKGRCKLLVDGTVVMRCRTRDQKDLLVTVHGTNTRVHIHKEPKRRFIDVVRGVKKDEYAQVGEHDNGRYSYQLFVNDVDFEGYFDERIDTESAPISPFHVSQSFTTTPVATSPMQVNFNLIGAMAPAQTAGQKRWFNAQIISRGPSDNSTLSTLISPPWS
jgi:hypothetical protein